jgi:hypothetical protein
MGGSCTRVDRPGIKEPGAHECAPRTAAVATPAADANVAGCLAIAAPRLNGLSKPAAVGSGGRKLFRGARRRNTAARISLNFRSVLRGSGSVCVGGLSQSLACRRRFSGWLQPYRCDRCFYHPLESLGVVVGAAHESHEFYGDAFVKHLFRYLWSWTLRGFKPVIHAVDTQSQQRILRRYHSLQHGTTV